jgi:hypothetical protein
MTSFLSSSEQINNIIRNSGKIWKTVLGVAAFSFCAVYDGELVGSINAGGAAVRG